MSLQESVQLTPGQIAARKAVATRRARLAAAGTAIVPADPRVAAFVAGPTPREIGLAAFERVAKAADTGQGMPDWHMAALALKAALTAEIEREHLSYRRPRASAPKAIPAPVWPDYEVRKVGAFDVRSDMLTVTFADGEIVRAPAVSAKGKPTNIGRGLRIAITFYQARACWRHKVEFLGGPRFPVPAITSCVCDDTGQVYDAGECTRRTIEDRRGQLRLPENASKVRRHLLERQFSAVHQ